MLSHFEWRPNDELWFSMKTPPLHMIESDSVCSLWQ